MIKLNFIVDDYFLASYLIRNNTPDRYIKKYFDIYKKDIVNFQNLAYKTSINLSLVIDGRAPIYNLLNNKNNPTPFSEIGSSLDAYITNLINTDYFRILKE